MNEMVYGRGAGSPEIRALGESLYAQCEENLPFLAIRQPEAYCEKQVPLSAGEKICCDVPAAVLAGPEDPMKLICDAVQIGRGQMPRALTAQEQDDVIRALFHAPRKRELEQAHFTLLFGGLSLSALTHLTRHRMQSMVAPDLLACADYEKYVLPQSVVNAGMEEAYRAAFAETAATVQLLTAMGEGKEIMPYLLLSGQTVPVVTTMNAGELYVFFRLRTCSRAQWEIREIATDMLKCLREKYPRLFNLYGPTCFVTGKCPEGKMCCGKTAEMKEKFSGTL